MIQLLLNNQKIKTNFYHRDDLLGICLGYGEKNADLFHKRRQILRSLGRLGFTLRVLSTEKRKNIESTLRTLEKSFHGGIKVHSSRRFLFHPGISFLADFTDPDTSKLQLKYTDAYKKIIQAYTQSPFLKRTLELIKLADENVDS